jgi:hypothetical protein
VASSLLAVCNGGSKVFAFVGSCALNTRDLIAFDVAALRDGQHYEGPTLVSNANSCICNTVTYSLMTACGLCQGKSTLRWNEWSKNCPNITFSGYAASNTPARRMLKTERLFTSRFPESLPSGLLVPAWAYQDIRVCNFVRTFNLS